MKNVKWIAWVAACLSITACEGPIDTKARAEIEELKRTISIMQTSIALERALGDAEKTEHVEFDVQGDPGYGKVSSPTGKVLITLEKVEPYLSGYIVHLRIGNPSSAGLIGATGEIKWGAKDVETSALVGKKFELTESFPPGSWRRVKIGIGAPPSGQLEKVVLIPKFNQISMAVLP